VPIDSEHFSIFNLIENKSVNSIKNIFLTASGGPFFRKNINLKKVTPLQAIKHPNWKMGKKISIDSATLMNKILEVIEASLIFNLPISKFKIIIHPESLVHAIVQFNNGLSSMLYYVNDMKIPIINSLYQNFNNLPKKQDFDKKYFQKLSFYKPNFKKVSSLKILQSKEILNEAGFTLINVVNEILVERFLKKKILFSDIVKMLLNILYSKTVLNYLKNKKISKIDDIFCVCNFSRSLIK
jgi:1-deoxy-D-xylulose-5-phosphate reductoisomerase